MILLLLKIQFSILTLLLLLILCSMLWLRYITGLRRTIREHYENKLCECLQSSKRLPDIQFSETEYAFNRRELIGLISELAGFVSGVESRMLLLIFKANGLYFHILQECKYGSPIQKVKALSIYRYLPVSRNMMGEIAHLLHSSHPEIKMMALLAWLNMEPARLFEKLRDYSEPLNGRECANIYQLVLSKNIPTSDAYLLFSSPNRSVVNFAENLLKSLNS